MDVSIKKYETIKKKNIFMENKIFKPKPVTTPCLKLKTKIMRINTCRSKNEENTSNTTDSSSNDKRMKIKKVTFSTIEIIRVEKYKKLNALNNFPKVCIDNNIEQMKNKKSDGDDKFICLIF